MLQRHCVLLAGEKVIRNPLTWGRGCSIIVNGSAALSGSLARFLCPLGRANVWAGLFLFVHCCATAFRLSVSNISHNAATFTRKRFPERTPGHLPCATSCRRWCSLVIPVAAVCRMVLNSGIIAPPKKKFSDTRKNRLHFVLYRVNII